MFPHRFSLQHKNQHKQIYRNIQQKCDQNAQNKHQGYHFAGPAFLQYGKVPHDPYQYKANIADESHPAEKY
jgi:hypothetical protein